MIDKLYVYYGTNVTHEQIESYMTQIPDDWKGLEVVLKKSPIAQKDKIYASETSMKVRGLNLLNKKW